MTDGRDRVRISAVIPAYNREKTVARAIDSALAQSDPPAEIIVVDDGSSDGTRGAVQRFGRKVRYIRQDNAGPSEARNRGVREASSEWVAFLDSDDFWLPHHLARMAEAIGATHGLANLYFANMRRAANEGGVLLWDACGFSVAGRFQLTHDAGDWIMLPRQPTMLQSSVFKRIAYLTAGGLRRDLRCRHDTHLFFELCLGGPACAVSEIGAEMTSDDDSGNRLTTAFGSQKPSYWHETVALYQDLLDRGFASRPADRREFRRRLASAHVALARVAWREKQVRRALSGVGRAFRLSPARVLEGSGRVVLRMARA
jgi:glycosyltransferase involved in cell wall biosynthesis